MSEDKEELLSRIKKLEADVFHLKTANCTHGFKRGQHTQGVVGCERCVGRRVMIWDLNNDNLHHHSLG